MNNPIIVLTGPTASGKTAISLEIAKKFDCEIICADSMTVYKGMDIGTDKPGKSNIPHYLLDIVSPDEDFNVAIFVQRARGIITEIQNRGKIPLIVGGSVMYIDALVYDYQMPEVAPNQKLRDELEIKTADELFAQLCELDPDCEWTIDRHNKRRLIRAIEICLSTGKSLAEQKNKKQLPENIIYFAVDRDREDLYNRINNRVDQMFAHGFVEEVRVLREKYDDSTALQAAGYRQIIQYLDGEIDLATAISKTKQVHRNYAKRQLTWLHQNEDVNWIENSEEANQKIKGFI